MDENKEKELLEEINSILIKKRGELLLVQSNHKYSDILSKYLETGEILSDMPNTLAVKRLCDAIKYCEEFVKEWKKSNRTLEDPFNPC